MADEKRQITITVNNCQVIEEYFPFTSFYKSAIKFSVVVCGECDFTVQLQMVLIVQVAAVFVCNILTL